MNLIYNQIGNNSHQIMQGISYEQKEIEQIFASVIKNDLLDNQQTINLVSEFENSIPSTEFDNTILVDLFKLDDIITEQKEWRIGEAFAEFHLENKQPARFYYNELSDVKNVFGNKTGTDLIGFIELNGDLVFLFGEVKTSNETKTPPQVLYSRRNPNGVLQKGLIDQLKDLAQDNKVRKQLIRYIANKVVYLPDNNNFKIDFKLALSNYLGDSDKFHIFGILVRDTKPSESDLKSRFKEIIKFVNDKTGLGLIALYIPIQMTEWNNLINKI